MTKKMRGVIVYDMEIDGDYSVVGDIETRLKKVAAEFSASVVKDTKGGEVRIIAHQAGMQDRRGDKTGPIENIIFRSGAPAKGQARK
ncbi:hypothetical protein N9O21_01915 [Rhodobacteraceae bacterium]|nr:hypothetical protein [Paracoccaceae bacterium]